VTGIKRQNADALMIWFIVACCGDVNDANGWVVGAAGLRDVCVTSAIVEGARIVAVAVAIVVKCVRPFADDGVDAEVRIVGGGDTRGNVNSNGDGVVKAAVAVVVGFISIAVAVAAAVVVAT
jgi:hypothetical protein